MDQSQEAVEETTESINPMDLDPFVSSPSEPDRSEHVSTEALLKFSQDMARVLDRLTALRALIDSVRNHGVEEFHGIRLEESDKAEFWLEKLQRALDEVKYPPEQMAKCAVSLLQGVAYDWWKLVMRNPLLLDPISWDFFVQEFQTKYVIDDYRETKWKQFLNLKQGYLIVAKYEKEFSRLSKYAPKLVLTETFRCRQFEDGLKESIKRYLIAVTSFQVVNFYQLVQAVMKIEKSEMMSQERKLERKLSRGSNSSGNRTRKSQVESVHSSATRGRRQGPTIILGSGRGTSFEQGERHECPHCHKYNFSACRMITGG